MKFPIHLGQCRCGKPRGHEDLCAGEIDPVIVDLNDRPRYSPWHSLRDRLVERYGKELGNFLAKRIGKTMKGKDCIDQFSVVEIPSRFWHFFMPSFYIAWGRHKEIREGGCCGEFTRDCTEPDAEEYDCPKCKQNTVMGAEQALLVGHITFKEEQRG